MIKTNRYAKINLNEEVLPAKWSEFINEYGFIWSKRSTSDYIKWKELRGKGYQIWISIPKPIQSDNKTYWEYAIDITNHIQEEGIKLLDDMMIHLQTTFPNTEIRKQQLTKPKLKKNEVEPNRWAQLE